MIRDFLACLCGLGVACGVAYVAGTNGDVGGYEAAIVISAGSLAAFALRARMGWP